MTRPADPGPRALPWPPLLAGWGVLLALATHSVVRYRWWLVAGYVAVAALLAAAALTRRRPRRALPVHVLAAAALGATAAVHALVPAFSYAPPATVRLVLAGLASASAAAALCWALAPRWRAGPGAALGIALAASALSGAAVVVGDPQPRIDVWVILQQAADGLAQGRSAYEQTWRGSPGIQDAFAYLPWTVVLTAPGRWLAGDVRWALAALVAGSALLLAATGRWRGPALAAACLLLLTPGSSTLVEQAWTEPTVLVGLAGWALLVARGRPGWAVLPLAVAVASKQHAALLLPLLAAWPGFGLRRTAATAGAAGVLVLPWLLAGPGAFWHDTVEVMRDLPPLRFADTAYLLLLHEFGVAAPLPLVGGVVLASVVAACWALRRRPAGLDGALLWCAVVLLVANLVNKQAFYNQYWLVGALLLLAWAASGAASAPGSAPTSPSAPGSTRTAPSALTAPARPDPARPASAPGVRPSPPGASAR
ncbi:hypothetical protein NUM3379_19110 [Kineococcus sp. NUM-3379]